MESYERRPTQMLMLDDNKDRSQPGEGAHSRANHEVVGVSTATAAGLAEAAEHMPFRQAAARNAAVQPRSDVAGEPQQGDAPRGWDLVEAKASSAKLEIWTSMTWDPEAFKKLYSRVFRQPFCGGEQGFAMPQVIKCTLMEDIFL